eukprot:TRINITY_DN1592_c3_g1_i1.p1 TRINITY_DN1592_c3_g1~~TRINITY_DN1592_c3_g1_i1.p1  ORF type:complete len:190 (+),score=31.19 TRINITY_DN1592_c3_g1_i1:85-654(+)
MNTKFHELPVIQVEEPQVSEILECVLHTILFQRQLGPVFPKEESLMEALAIPLTYCKVGDADGDIHQKVNKCINGFRSALSKLKSDQKRDKTFHVHLRFSQSTGAHALEWERWVIQLSIQPRCNKTTLLNTMNRVLNIVHDATNAAIEDDSIPSNNSDAHHTFSLSHEVGGGTFIDTVGSFLSYLTPTF